MSDVGMFQWMLYIVVLAKIPRGIGANAGCFDIYRNEENSCYCRGAGVLTFQPNPWHYGFSSQMAALCGKVSTIV